MEDREDLRVVIFCIVVRLADASWFGWAMSRVWYFELFCGYLFYSLNLKMSMDGRVTDVPRSISEASQRLWLETL